MNKLTFPKNFYWGAATSAHQVEGNNYNDWTEWEHANSARLADEAARRHANAPTRIPDFILKRYPNPLQEENYISGRAGDHYNRFEEDFDIANSLNHNAHRFSIEWSRVEPEEGKFSEEAIEHYQQVIVALKARGIEPFVTLWHWTNPIWFAQKQGFFKKENIKYFVRFVSYFVSRFKNVNFFLTLNEPEIYAGNSFLKGIWPPQEKSPINYLEVLRNLIKAHQEAFQVIKKISPHAQIGIAKNNVYFDTANENFFTPFLKRFINWWWNRYFINQIKNYSDFIGLNYYFHNRISGWRFGQNENKIVSDMGWEIYPKGIYEVLKDLKIYNKPIYITENGVADARSVLREDFIREHLFWIYRAIKEGVDVRGYFYWSLLDNFEWDKGFWPRFGLVGVDYKTTERHIRKSAQFYAKIAKNNCLEI